ncbi:PH domain-containing protein [Staphylococcus caprae]
MFLIEFFIIPKYKLKRWRYGIDDRSVHISYGGAIRKTYKQIPLNKIYYIKKSQNIISKKLNIYTVNIGTLANVHKIPALSKDKANILCEMVMQFQNNTKVEDSDSNETIKQ